MNPDVSRAIGLIKARLELPPDSPQMGELLHAGERAETVDDLPPWAVGVLHAIEREQAKAA